MTDEDDTTYKEGYDEGFADGRWWAIRALPKLVPVANRRERVPLLLRLRTAWAILKDPWLFNAACALTFSEMLKKEIRK